MGDDKRSFLREHRFTVTDYIVLCVVTIVVGEPMFYAIIWLMGQILGVAVPVDAVLMLILLTFLLSTCAGMSAALVLLRRMVRKRSDPK